MMICEQISSMIGISCLPVSDSGDIAELETPFTFDDGSSLPIFVQTFGPQVRFFDDGGVMFHFLGRGLDLGDARKCKFIRGAAEANGGVLTEAGNVEIWAPIQEAPAAFARYMTAMLQIASWERDQRGSNVDISLLIEDVEMCLRAWRPDAQLIRNPEYQGISGQVHVLHFKLDNQGILATSTHPNAISSSIKKALDIYSAIRNDDGKILVVIDDRADHELAKRESLVVQAVADVMMFSSLEKYTNTSSARN